MTEVLSNNTTDKVGSLVKEAEALKAKLEEERQKLNDVTCAGNGGQVNQPTNLKLTRARSVCTLSPNKARRCPKFLHTPAHEFRTKKDWSDDGGVKSEFSI
uniref:(northern house mosquito) hypothetical protein n=1 Tax=Culex pipiens TaxID=7175 RepID=A0A8D8P1T4_CULPI